MQGRVKFLVVYQTLFLMTKTPFVGSEKPLVPPGTNFWGSTFSIKKSSATIDQKYSLALGSRGAGWANKIFVCVLESSFKVSRYGFTKSML
mmetsp:Transcript_6956/g.9092  ORF Transcript_6956/g.9092 Transcript_6956/m.9092 type:complete len:91 (+) Transcript_6956:213-485(+)